jgi:hypothetical protein
MQISCELADGFEIKIGHNRPQTTGYSLRIDFSIGHARKTGTPWRKMRHSKCVDA